VKLKIGIFDSGIGGFTILNSILKTRKDVKVLDMEKMIPPPKDQQFFIKNAKIKNIAKKITVNKFINNKLSIICFNLF